MLVKYWYACLVTYWYQVRRASQQPYRVRHAPPSQNKQARSKKITRQTCVPAHSHSYISEDPRVYLQKTSCKRYLWYMFLFLSVSACVVAVRTCNHTGDY